MVTVRGTPVARIGGSDAPHPPSRRSWELSHVAIRRNTVLVEVADCDLIARYQETGCAATLDQIINRYRRFARAKARGYFLIGGDSDDVEQEALIGLYLSLIHI